MNAPNDIIERMAEATRRNLDALVPIGSIIMWATDKPPLAEGRVVWLQCDGRAVSRAEYPDLFNLSVGQGWGDGDGAGTFNLPDLRLNEPILLRNRPMLIRAR